VISVRDTGNGIAPAQLESLFEAFRQGDGSTTRTHGGLGIGLALSRQYARLMGGDLTVASQLGTGSTFTLTIPGVAGITTVGMPGVAARPVPPAPARVAEGGWAARIAVPSSLGLLDWAIEVAQRFLPIRSS
jgi:hypothetical protein